MMTRTWEDVMQEIIALKTKNKALRRWNVAVKDKALDGIRDVPLLETRPDQFHVVLKNGKVSTNIYLRRIHNFALGMNWLPRPVLPKKKKAGLEEPLPSYLGLVCPLTFIF